MSAPANQRRVTAQEALEQCRRNRREAAILESRNGQQQIAKSAALPISPPVSTVRK